MKKSIKAALYVRVPRNLEGRVHMQGHVNALKDYCLGKGYDMDDSRIYTDIGSAQVSISERPGYQKLLNDSSEGKFSKVVIRDLQSVARTLVAFIEFQSHMDHFSVEVESLVEQYDSTTPKAQQMTEMISSVAKLERGLITRRRKFVQAHDPEVYE